MARRQEGTSLWREQSAIVFSAFVPVGNSKSNSFMVHSTICNEEYFFQDPILYLLLLKTYFWLDSEVEALGEDSLHLLQSVPSAFLWLPSLPWPKVLHILQPPHFPQCTVSSEQYVSVVFAGHIESFFKYSFYVYRCCVCMYGCVPLVCLVSSEARRQCQIPWDWCYRPFEPLCAWSWTFVFWKSNQGLLTTESIVQPPGFESPSLSASTSHVPGLHYHSSV